MKLRVVRLRCRAPLTTCAALAGKSGAHFTSDTESDAKTWLDLGCQLGEVPGGSGQQVVNTAWISMPSGMAAFPLVESDKGQANQD